MFGDILRNNAHLLTDASEKSNDENAFWKILRDIAREEIKSFSPNKVDSDLAIELYYKILVEKIDLIPQSFTRILPSNGQEKFRVCNRNLWSSNAFHSDGLANQIGIKTKKVINENKKGYKIVYWYSEEEELC